MVHVPNKKDPESMIALCLSGGGYRAMLFHLGALMRLNEFGYLVKISRFSSVSGGSITAAWLGFVWSQLDFDERGVAQNFEDVVVNPIRKFATRRLDVLIALSGLLNPFKSIGDMLAGAYRKHLFGRATLQDLPHFPEFIIDASNAQTGALWRFSKARMGGYLVGYVKHPETELAKAVAASSAFPPFFSPFVLNLEGSKFSGGVEKSLQRPPYTTRVTLMDGGVYDNLGLEPALIPRFDTILVSDSGGKMQPMERPPFFWPTQVYRLISLIDNQVRALRKRQIIAIYKEGRRKGTYWGSFSDIARYQVDSPLDAPEQKTLKLAKLPTRLSAFSDGKQRRLINWGYAICDAAMRKHVDPTLPPPDGFPYPGGVG